MHVRKQRTNNIVAYFINFISKKAFGKLSERHTANAEKIIYP